MNKFRERGTLETKRFTQQEKNILSLVLSFRQKLFRKIIYYYQELFQKRNHVYVHQGPFRPVRSSFCEFVRYIHFDQIPKSICEAIVRLEGMETLDMDRQELDQEATMWVALVDQNLASVLFTRRGCHFKHWFVELLNDDIVLFRVRTYPEHRGRGIASSLMRFAMHNSLKQGDRAFIDCRVHNKPSIRCIQKAAFNRIATMKPISREKALFR